MSTTPFYPSLEQGDLRIVMNMLSENPNYLSDPACPYSEETKSIFQKTTSTESTGIVNNIQRQINTLDKLNEQLEKQSLRFDNNELEPSEANAYFRQRVNIAREILELQEKLAHVSNVTSFCAKMLEVMEDVLDVESRETVIKEITEILTKEG